MLIEVSSALKFGTIRNIEQYKEVLFDTKSFDEVLYSMCQSLGASADKAATVDGPSHVHLEKPICTCPSPSAHCRQVISTPLWSSQTDTPHQWHVRVVLSSK